MKSLKSIPLEIKSVILCSDKMDNSKKFCFVVPDLPPVLKEAKGGSEIQVHLIAQELLKRGWEVHCIRESNQTVGQKEKANGIFIHSLPERHTKLKWLNIRPLFRLMQKIEADVWYCRATVSYVFPVWLNAKKIGGKVIWSCSSDRFLTKRLIVKELKKESLLRKVASFMDRFFFLKALKKIDLVILQSYKQKKMLEDNWGLKGVVIYSGQPIAPLKNKERESLILWIGRLTFGKHPERLIEVVKRLKEKPYKFLAVGREVEEVGYAKEFLKTENEIPSFQYLGEIEQEEVSRLLERTKLLVNTSDYEGFSNTFIEAWLRGVPVVSLKVDPDELIQKNSLGRVSLSIKQLVNDIEHLMEESELWQQTSKRSRNFAEENFNITDKIDLLEELISNLN